MLLDLTAGACNNLWREGKTVIFLVCDVPNLAKKNNNRISSFNGSIVLNIVQMLYVQTILSSTDW